MTTLIVWRPGVRSGSGTRTGLTASPGHQPDRDRSDEDTPFQKLPDAGFQRRRVPQSLRHGTNRETIRPSSRISFTLGVNSIAVLPPTMPRGDVAKSAVLEAGGRVEFHGQRILCEYARILLPRHLHHVHRVE